MLLKRHIYITCFGVNFISINFTANNVEGRRKTTGFELSTLPIYCENDISPAHLATDWLAVCDK